MARRPPTLCCAGVPYKVARTIALTTIKSSPERTLLPMRDSWIHIRILRNNILHMY